MFGSFPYNNVQQYSVGDAALSTDGKLIYFTSDMPGGEGKTDIWYCQKQPNGVWGVPVNCGKTINTKDEEAYPTIGGDGALYYSSKGLPGMGGYDIYKAKGSKAEWTMPQNLQYPVNTTSDDFYLTTHNGLNGYLSSNRSGGLGSDDIYSFSYGAADTVKKTPPVAKAIPAKPKASLPVLKPAPPPITIAPGLILATIYYDLDKSNIRPDAAIELDKLAVLMQQHPRLRIELSSYTDSRASGNYNMALSQRRANAVVAYLAKQGIDKSRLVARFYGKTNLVNPCGDGVPCLEAAHQLNRRTEFKVIGGD
jgi:outer membrane protein OmpA-like peptidoglycan-associated protein